MTRNTLDLVSCAGGSRACHAARGSRRARRGFSLIEMLVALTISATLLTAALMALDVMFKRYNAISDTASSNVIARVAVHRVLQMIRTGKEFGPAPTNVLDATQNPADHDRIEFVSFEDAGAGIREITRFERRAAAATLVAGETTGLRGPFVLWMVVDRTESGETTRTERPILDGVLDCRFNLAYDVGPRLIRATVDISLQPGGTNYAKYDADSGTWTISEYNDQTGQWVDRQAMNGGEQNPSIRMVASTRPRMSVIDDE
jgi:prepilin-type N-terminal cleavage/methylation domain-containing protein